MCVMLYFVLLAWTLGLVRLLEILMVLVMILEDGIGINNNTITIAYFIKTVRKGQKQRVNK
jgi:hypothetical protein